MYGLLSYCESEQPNFTIIDKVHPLCAWSLFLLFLAAFNRILVANIEDSSGGGMRCRWSDANTSRTSSIAEASHCKRFRF